jgi:hypothetical protein
MKINTVKNRMIQTLVAIAALCILGSDTLSASKNLTRPNILFCISDDQSYAHTGANGDPVIQTPAFDRIAREQHLVPEESLLQHTPPPSALRSTDQTTRRI